MLQDSKQASETFREAFRGKVNRPHDEIYKNIRSSIRRQLPQVSRHPKSEYKVLLLCGGPSLADGEKQIRRLYHHGWKLFTVNGSHKWARERGMEPSIHAQLDSREFNAKFVEEPSPGCKYLICSQCDPAVFDTLKHNEVYIWHGPGEREPEAKILDNFYLGCWAKVPGGSCIGTRAIGLAYLLGIRTLRIFGMDACLRHGKHHAYPQEGNGDDSERQLTVRVGRRRFRSHAWMIAQVDEMLQLAAMIPDHMNISFEGDGLISYVVNETARRGKPPPMRVEK